MINRKENKSAKRLLFKSPHLTEKIAVPVIKLRKYLALKRALNYHVIYTNA